MRIKRAILSIICSSALVIAGCSSTGPDDSPADNAPESGETGGETGGDTDPDGDQEPPQPDTSDLPDVVASVNDTEITREMFVIDYQARFDQMAMTNPGGEIDQGSLKLEVADLLISRELIVQAAEADGIEATDEVIDEVLQEVAAQSGLESLEEFLELASQQGLDEDEIRADARDQHLIEVYIDENVDIPEASEEELRANYDKAIEDMKEQGAEDDQIPDFEDVREELKAEAQSIEMSTAIDKLVEELREGADVQVYL